MRSLLASLAVTMIAVTVSAQTTFTRITEGIMVNDPGDSRSVNWIDYDNDGDLDIFVTNGTEGGADNFLYRNDAGTFVKITDDPIVTDHTPSDGSTWGDYDNDGDVDCFVANWYNINNLLYANDGDGTFSQVTTGPVVNDHGYSESGSWADYDNDGWLDLIVANSAGTNHSNFLYHNNGDGNFTRITEGDLATNQGSSRAPMWCDYDNDADLDIFIPNESGETDFLYRNEGGGSFTRITEGPVVTTNGTSMSASWGDYDNDGDFDLFVANAGGSPNNCNQADFLFRNEGNGTFTRMTDSEVELHGGCSFGSLWADFDNDANLDLFVTNGFRATGNTCFLYMNNGDGTFSFVTEGEIVTDGGWTYGCAAADYDRDGDLDVYVATWTPPTENDRLYRNNATSENYYTWLNLRLVGTLSNLSAIGARISVKTVVNNIPLWQMREVSGQSGYCGQTLEQHFGLALADTVDSLVIRWPSGITETYTNIPVNQHLTFTENGGVAGVGPQGAAPAQFGLRVAYPNPFNPSTEIVFELPRVSTVSLKIFDISGREVETLVSDTRTEGTHHVLWNSGVAASGVYFCRMQAGDYAAALKLIKVE